MSRIGEVVRPARGDEFKTLAMMRAHARYWKKYEKSEAERFAPLLAEAAGLGDEFQFNQPQDPVGGG
jgi:hypothetical protein